MCLVISLGLVCPRKQQQFFAQLWFSSHPRSTRLPLTPGITAGPWVHDGS